MVEQLWRVYSHTDGDESVSERIVTAASSVEAEKKAILNIGAQNIGKGLTDQATSQKNTHILCCKKAGKDGVLTINRIPVAAIQAMKGYDPEVQGLRDFLFDMGKIAGIEPHDATVEEVAQIIEEMTKCNS